MSTEFRCCYCGNTALAKRRSRMYCSNSCKTLACREQKKIKAYNRLLQKQNEKIVEEMQQAEALKAAEEAQRKATHYAAIAEIEEEMDSKQKKYVLEAEERKTEIDRKRQKKREAWKAREEHDVAFFDQAIRALNNLNSNIATGHFQQQSDQQKND